MTDFEQSGKETEKACPKCGAELVVRPHQQDVYCQLCRDKAAVLARVYEAILEYSPEKGDEQEKEPPTA